MDSSDPGSNWVARLVDAIERAAEAGYAQTARFSWLLAVAAAAVALVVYVASR